MFSMINISDLDICITVYTHENVESSQKDRYYVCDLYHHYCT